MASPHSSVSGNPFGDPEPEPISAATAQLINIKTHVPVVLDPESPNYTAWSTFFDIAFRKFGILDHVDGTVDIRLKHGDVEWLQVDASIVSWLYATISADLLNAIIKPRDSTYRVWTSIAEEFLGNARHRATQAQQEFHSLHQGELSISDYYRQLKMLADTLRDVGKPVTDSGMVINMLRGLNPKFSHVVTTVNAAQPPMTFQQARWFLLQEESWLANSSKLAMSTALLAKATANASNGATAGTGGQTPSPAVIPTNTSPGGGGSDRPRKRKKQDNRPR
ncbi:uncharacterized protein LOC133898604 [Phragmites australis]|uniref:uncharacterized protein LOC133898604 n=1 Tax=Phragmites australis TaxID=29695 RepID=UPI002D7852EF|nr:uncharacterized protein LOC133898604 [Phragmites australis]